MSEIDLYKELLSSKNDCIKLQNEIIERQKIELQTFTMCATTYNNTYLELMQKNGELINLNTTINDLREKLQRIKESLLLLKDNVFESINQTRIEDILSECD